MGRFVALWCATAVLCACAWADLAVHVTVVADFTTDAEAKDAVATVAAVRSLVRTLTHEPGVARIDVASIAPAGLSAPLRDALEAATATTTTTGAVDTVLWREPFANEATALNRVLERCNSSDDSSESEQENVLHVVLDAHVDPDSGFVAAARADYAAARGTEDRAPLVTGFVLRNPDGWTVYHAGLDVSAAALAYGAGQYGRSAAAADWPRNVPTPYRVHAGMPVAYAHARTRAAAGTAGDAEDAFLLGAEAFAFDARTHAALGAFNTTMSDSVFLLDYALRAHAAPGGRVRLCRARGAGAVFLAGAATLAARAGAAYTMAALEPLHAAWLGVLQARVAARVRLAPQAFVWVAECAARGRAHLEAATTTLLALAELHAVLDVRADVGALAPCLAELRAAQYPAALVDALERAAQREAPRGPAGAGANTTLLLQREPPRYGALVRALSSTTEPVRRALGLCKHAGSAVPADWAAEANSRAVQQVLVPTAFGVAQLARSGVNATPVAVLPPPVDTDLFSPACVADADGDEGKKRDEKKKKKNTTFSFVAQDAWEPRSALPELIAAYIDEFGADDDVALTLRLARTDRYDLDQAHAAIRAAAQAKLDRCNNSSNNTSSEGEGLATHSSQSSCTLPRLPVVDTEFVPWVQLPRRLAQHDAFVTAAHATGFGRATVEAMALGLPVVALNASARAAYLTDANAYLVPVAAHDVISAVQPGITWARVDTAALGHAMRRVYRERGARARDVGRAARATAVAHFSRAAFRARLLALLADADATLPRYDPAAVVAPAAAATSTAAATEPGGTTGIQFSTALNDRPTRIRINP